MAGVEQPPEISTRRVLEAIARHLGTDVSTLRRPNREQEPEVREFRRAALVVLRERYRLSYHAIARLLGRTKKQVVHESYWIVRKLPRTRALVAELEHRLEAQPPRDERDVEAEFRRAREAAAGLVGETRRT